MRNAYRIHGKPCRRAAALPIGTVPLVDVPFLKAERPAGPKVHLRASGQYSGKYARIRPHINIIKSSTTVSCVNVPQSSSRSCFTTKILSGAAVRYRNTGWSIDHSHEPRRISLAKTVRANHCDEYSHRQQYPLVNFQDCSQPLSEAAFGLVVAE